MKRPTNRGMHPFSAHRKNVTTLPPVRLRHHPDTSDIPTAIAIGVRECKLAGTTELALITPVKDHLDSMVVGEFLGRDVAKRLMKGDKIKVGDHGVSLTPHTSRSVWMISRIYNPNPEWLFWGGQAGFFSRDAIKLAMDFWAKRGWRDTDHAEDANDRLVGRFGHSLWRQFGMAGGHYRCYRDLVKHQGEITTRLSGYFHKPETFMRPWPGEKE